MNLASLIDHTLLKPDTTGAMIEKLCAEAIEYRFCSVCVNPVWVPFAVELLEGEYPLVCSVVGFPLGATPLVAKEAEWVVLRGAGEVDMVLPVGLLKQGENSEVLRVIKDVVDSVSGIPVKVILETCLLTREEKITACSISMDAGAAFVKTSTGFSESGATVPDIVLMRNTVGLQTGVKASGGIRDYEKAVAMVEAGASRIGTSSGITIVNGSRKNSL
ncbi:MAG: deoxyribose-phosphate aldolase [Candidatus Sabulitectum sp.]|nr:deoxyribose-phosphate aldolase [Candidatus Sabulitectum sp.]